MPYGLPATIPGVRRLSSVRKRLSSCQPAPNSLASSWTGPGLRGGGPRSLVRRTGGTCPPAMARREAPREDPAQVRRRPTAPGRPARPRGRLGRPENSCRRRRPHLRLIRASRLALARRPVSEAGPAARAPCMPPVRPAYRAALKTYRKFSQRSHWRPADEARIPVAGVD
jgi:hypothetical protein